MREIPFEILSAAEAERFKAIFCDPNWKRIDRLRCEHPNSVWRNRKQSEVVLAVDGPADAETFWISKKMPKLMKKCFKKREAFYIVVRRGEKIFVLTPHKHCDKVTMTEPSQVSLH